MSDVEVKRQFVASLYPGEKWKKKVIAMPESQVIAIYFREQARKGEKERKANPKEKHDGSDIPF